MIVDNSIRFADSFANNPRDSKSRGNHDFRAIWQIRLIGEFDQVNHVVEEWGCDLDPDS